MNKRQFYDEVENILEVPSGSLKGDEVLKDFEQWDSLAVLSFIAMADATLQTLISSRDLAKCQNVADLVGLFPGKITD
jgi:acyl carrier protein